VQTFNLVRIINSTLFPICRAKYAWPFLVGPDSNNRFLSTFVKSAGPDRSKGRGCEKARTWFTARKACVRRVHSRGDKRRLEEPPDLRERRARAPSTLMYTYRFIKLEPAVFFLHHFPSPPQTSISFQLSVGRAGINNYFGIGAPSPLPFLLCLSLSLCVCVSLSIHPSLSCFLSLFLRFIRFLCFPRIDRPRIYGVCISQCLSAYILQFCSRVNLCRRLSAWYIARVALK